MLNYDVLSKKPSAFRYFSGLELHEFDALNLKINERYTAFEQKRLFRADRKREIGAGHPFKLSLTDRLLMLLVYYHIYVSSTLAAYLFDLSQTNVLKNIRNLEPLVSQVLPLPKKQHEKVWRLQTLDEVEAMFPGFKAFLDATEQEIPRPKAKRKQKTHYSGKKKKHTVKTQITVNKDGFILQKTRHTRAALMTMPCLSRVIRICRCLGLDLGYDGVKTDYPELGCEVLFKRRSPGRGKRGVKAKGLTPEQKSFNKRLSKERVVVEHTFSRVKKFRIWAEEFRNRLKHYNTMTEIVCGLVNLRIAGTTVI
jgi:hypothetical protein